VKGLVPDIDFDADTRTRRELADAIQRLRHAIESPPLHVPSEDDDDEPPVDEEEEAHDANRPPSDATLKKLSITDIYKTSRHKVQAALSAKLATVEAKAIHAELIKRGELAAAARLKDRWQRGASAWLNACRKDPYQQMKNAHFRVAVGWLLGINCFKEIPHETPCPFCHKPVGDLMIHRLRCKAAYTGDNNRRHNAMQQTLLYLLRLSHSTVITTPGMVSFTGATAKAPEHERRQLDLGVRGLDDGPDIALDLCVSDCGTGKPNANYKTGSKCAAKGKAKRSKYLARFNDIPAGELCCPSYGASGSRDTDALELQKRINNALALANPEVPYSVTAARVNRVISVALQKAIAYNALDFRYTKLSKNRAVGAEVPLIVQGGDDWDDDDDADDDDD
jgi:hypothetical protein